MEMRATPLCGVLSSVTVEDGKEALATYQVKVNNKRVRILHGSSRALVL